MGIIWTLIIGLVAGIVAKFLMPGPDPGGIIVTILLGVAGAFLATWLGQTIGWYQAEGAGFIGAVVGAVIILVLYRMMRCAAAPRERHAPPAGRGDGINHALTLAGYAPGAIGVFGMRWRSADWGCSTWMVFGSCAGAWRSWSRWRCSSPRCRWGRCRRPW